MELGYPHKRPYDLWKLYINDDMIKPIQTFTNQSIRERKNEHQGGDESEITLAELKMYFALEIGHVISVQRNEDL